MRTIGITSQNEPRATINIHSKSISYWIQLNLRLSAVNRVYWAHLKSHKYEVLYVDCWYCAKCETINKMNDHTKKEGLDEDGKAPVEQYEWFFVCIPTNPTFLQLRYVGIFNFYTMHCFLKCCVQCDTVGS